MNNEHSVLTCGIRDLLRTFLLFFFLQIRLVISSHACLLGCIVKEVFSLRSKGAHEIMWCWHVKIQKMAKFSRKIAFPISTRGQKRSNFPKMSYISRNSPVVQKLEQLEQNRKKHLKTHSAGYRRLHIGFELKSVFKVLEVIKGQNNVLCENSFSWINLEVLKLEPLF